MVNKLKEKCREYCNDYGKAFNSIQSESQTISSSLQEQGLEWVYIDLLKEIQIIMYVSDDIVSTKGKNVNMKRGDTKDTLYLLQTVHGKTRTKFRMLYCEAK